MPYKDPERKRQWEREHRDLRKARRAVRLRLKLLSRKLCPTQLQTNNPRAAGRCLQAPPSGWALLWSRQ